MRTKNRIIFGLMNYGPEGPEASRVTSLDEFKSCLDYFQAKGYNEVDTARGYCDGLQESWTAKAGWKERGLKLATKNYPTGPGSHRPDELLKRIDQSLKELGTDSIDIFYLHAPDRSTLFEETLKGINEAYKAGKIKQFAISNFTAAEVAEVCMICKHNGWIRPTLYQGMYNCLARGCELDLVPTLRRFGLDWAVYNPIAGGFLSGKYRTDDIPETGRFGRNAHAGEMSRGRYFKEGQFEALKIIEQAAEKHGFTIIECAYRWLVRHSALRTREKGGNDGIVFGASSRAQFDENIANLEKGPLPDDVVEAMDQAWKCIAGSAPYYFQGHGKPEYGYDTIKAIYG